MAYSLQMYKRPKESGQVDSNRLTRVECNDETFKDENKTDQKIKKNKLPITEEEEYGEGEDGEQKRMVNSNLTLSRCTDRKLQHNG